MPQGVRVRLSSAAQLVLKFQDFFMGKVVITVYIIRSISRNYIYVGQTNNLERRLFEHNNGYNRSTKAYCPFELIHTEDLADRTLARDREKFLKSTSGKRFIHELIESRKV